MPRITVPRLSAPLLRLPRTTKRLIALTADVGFCALGVWLAYCLRLGEITPIVDGAWIAIGASISLALPLFVISGLYRAIFRYSGWPALLAVARATGIYGIAYAVIFTVIGIPAIPRTIGILQPILLLLFVGGSRVLIRFWLGDQYQNILRRAARPKILIYGAGSSGRQLAAAIVAGTEMQAAGFLDDDDRLHGHVLDNLPIYNPEDLPTLSQALSLSEVLLAMPNIVRKRRNAILKQLCSANVCVRTLPTANAQQPRSVTVSDIQKLDIDDLLGREYLQPNHILLAKNIVGKVVVVTGAGGAVGSELCRNILKIGPTKLLLLEQSEFALHSIHQELEKMRGSDEPSLIPLLASILDAERLHEIFSTWQPNTIYHAAASTHVAIIEHNPAEGIKNNVFGTLKTAASAADNGVSDFILVSTDQAAAPGNIMAASKRLAEMALQLMAAGNPAMRFCVVRFGDVLTATDMGVPKIRQQILNGDTIEIPHLETARTFMPLAEAVQLLIQAGAMARGGEIFSLDMGQPVRLIDLVRSTIALSGLTIKDEQNPEGDIEIRMTGPSLEKNPHEACSSSNVGLAATAHAGVMRIAVESIDEQALAIQLNSLSMALAVNDVGVIRLMMKQMVPGYAASGDIMDWVYMEQEAKAD